MKEHMPIVNALRKFAASGALRMNMPGHKGVIGLDFLNEAAKIDVTECSFSDNLLMPQGIIKESQALYAQLFGASQAHFCVNGSTSGLWAMIAAADKLLVMRHSHAAVFNAVEALRKKCFVLNSDIKDNKFIQPSDEQILQAALETGVDTVLITTPDYYGFCCGSKELQSELRKRNIRLFADSAHGAHFGLHDKLPPHAITFCDACVVSTHKTLCALNQTAVLMANDDQLGRLLKQKLKLFTTTSPSYPLLASIDYAREFAENANERYEELYRAIQGLSDDIGNSPIKRVHNDDFTRLVLDVSDISSGFECQAFLEANGIYIEMSDDKRIVCILTAADGYKEVSRLSEALKSFMQLNNSRETRFSNDVKKIAPYTEYLPYVSSIEEIPLSEATGKRAATDIGLMPPCLPLILKGEIIRSETVAYLTDTRTKGRVYGLTSDGKVTVEK